jgi:hypothetical protein
MKRGKKLYPVRLQAANRWGHPWRLLKARGYHQTANVWEGPGWRQCGLDNASQENICLEKE